MAPLHKPSLGTLRSYYLTLTVMTAGLMAGYDSGVAGGVLTFSSFATDFHYTARERSKVNSFTVALQQLGSFAACFVAYPLTARYGRKLAIQVAAAVFMVGVVVETASKGSLAAWYVGRVVAGVGQGALCVVVPIYSAEMAPKEIRGRLGSLYQWDYTVGILLSYWVDYGVNHNIPPISRQWQIPVALQLVSSGILFTATFTLPESTRWLLKQNRPDLAWRSLSWIRASEAETVRAEFRDMKANIAAEAALKEGLGWRELTTVANQKRFALGALTFLFQQGTGATALAYFGPQFFQQIVGKSGDRALLVTGLFGAIKVVACTIFILFVAEAFGRRTLMAGGSAVMGVCMLITALLAKYFPPPKSSNEPVSSANAATVAMIFINIAAYNMSWGPIPWAYVPELFPNRTRELGVAVSVAIHWLFSFVFSVATPYMQASMGWGLFLFYFVFDAVMFGFCWFSFKETRNKSLEKVDAEFEHRDMGVEAGSESDTSSDVKHGAPVVDGDDSDTHGTYTETVPGKAPRSDE